MTAKGWLYLVLALLALICVGAGGLFWIQNSLRTTQLSINLGFAAWQLARPVPVVALIAGSFGFGFFFASVPLLWRSWGLSARIQSLEREIALAPRNDKDRKW